MPRICSSAKPSFSNTIILAVVKLQYPEAVRNPDLIYTDQTGLSSQMYSIILTITTSLLLPLLTTAEGPIYRPKTWPPVVEQPYYWGDTLNITKCYCQGVNDDTNPGHYFQFDYRNFHREEVYTLAWTCDSDATTTGKGTMGPKRLSFPVPDCWNAHDVWRKEKRKECVRSRNADTFCFELGDKHDPFDYYYFNEQKRGLPDFGIVDFPPDECVALCRDKVGGKAVASEYTFDSQKIPCGRFANPRIVFRPQ